MRAVLPGNPEAECLLQWHVTGAIECAELSTASLRWPTWVVVDSADQSCLPNQVRFALKADLRLDATAYVLNESTPQPEPLSGKGGLSAAPSPGVF